MRLFLLFHALISEFLFLSFPAGLMLYWIVNNLLFVLQQWMIMRRIEQTSNKK